MKSKSFLNDSSLMRTPSVFSCSRKSGVRALQVGGTVRLVGILIAHRVGEVLVERCIPRTLNEAAAWRVVVRRRQRQPRAAADSVHRLDKRLAERRLADDVRAIVV